jgi:DNA-directed RNA polymerase I, II, and III subunit RPABC2
MSDSEINSSDSDEEVVFDIPEHSSRTAFLKKNKINVKHIPKEEDDDEELEDEVDDEDDDEIDGIIGDIKKTKKSKKTFYEDDEEIDVIDDDEDEDDSDVEEDNEFDIDNLDITDKSHNKKNAKKTHDDEYIENEFNYLEDSDNDDNDEPDEDEGYLQKFNDNIRKNIIADYHPELNQISYEEIEGLSVITKNESGVIVDPLHRTLPFLTKYEKARILGERAKQLNAGAKSFISLDPSIIDGYIIAVKELEEKKIPFIIKRPLPNGGCEYWKLKDLEILI